MMLLSSYLEQYLSYGRPMTILTPYFTPPF
jgi:hypothetical protein